MFIPSYIAFDVKTLGKLLSPLWYNGVQRRMKICCWNRHWRCRCSRQRRMMSRCRRLRLRRVTSQWCRKTNKSHTPCRCRWTQRPQVGRHHCAVFFCWKVLENKFDPEKSSKLKFKVRESPGIYLWFDLTNVTLMYRTLCVNKCVKYSCNVLTEQFLFNFWWMFARQFLLPFSCHSNQYGMPCRSRSTHIPECGLPTNRHAVRRWKTGLMLSVVYCKKCCANTNLLAYLLCLCSSTET